MFDFLDLSTLIYRVPALLLALSFHEYAHAVVSDSLGDPTPSATGRLTMNPLAHLDAVGTLLLVLCGFGWAKPVMIDPRYYNLLLCFISIFLMGLLQRFGMLGMGGYQFLYWIMLYNVWFAFFNLIPVPPLDGSKVVSMLLPGELSWKFENFNAQYGFIILMVVVFSGVANKFLSPLSNLFVTLCYNITYILL